MESDFTNRFNWSVSRRALFQRCKRMYYYHYYYFWEGWTTAVDEAVNKAYMLKNIDNIYSTIGNLTHKIIAAKICQLVKGNIEDIQFIFDKKSLYQDITKQVEKLYWNSVKKIRGKKFEQILRENTNHNHTRYYLKNLGLTEHYKNEIVPEHDNFVMDEIIGQVYTNLISLGHHDLIKFVIECIAKARKDSLPFHIEYETDFEKSKFYFDPENLNILCYARPDLFFTVENGDRKIIILDWKTGNLVKYDETLNKLTDQLKVYSYRTLNESMVDSNTEPPTVEAYEVYLPNGEMIGGYFKSEDYEDIENKIREDVKVLSGSLVDADFRANNPKDKEWFEKTENPLTCKYCNFSGLCDA